MTDLIPRDAAASVCDKHSYSNNPYVSGRMADAAAEIRAIPTIDPAAIREAALREAAEIATARWAARREHADHLAELDYPEAMIDAKTVSAKADEAEMIAEQILALIPTKGAADDRA